MKIDLTKKQYEELLNLVFLGRWMVAAHNLSESATAFEETEQHILSLAKKFDCGDYVELDEDSKTFFTTDAFETNTEVLDIIDRYNDDTFWDDLIFRLSVRDMVKAFGEDALNNMSIEERDEKQKDYLNTYIEEFEANGVDNLVIAGAAQQPKKAGGRKKG